MEKEVVMKLLEKILGWFYWRFWRWLDLRGFYKRAVRRGKGDKRLKQAAMKILRSDFFDEFVKDTTVTIEQEFTKFL